MKVMFLFVGGDFVDFINLFSTVSCELGECKLIKYRKITSSTLLETWLLDLSGGGQEILYYRIGNPCICKC